VIRRQGITSRLNPGRIIVKMKQLLPERPKITRYLVTLVAAAAGGFLFESVHLPIPWLLGPMTAVFIGSLIRKGQFAWSGKIRNIGLVLIGYMIGLSLTVDALLDMSMQLPIMLLMTILLLVVCAGIAFVMSRWTGIGFLTALMGSVPGGLSQIVALAEETKDVSVTAVTVMQVIRLMIIIVCIPLFIFSPFFHSLLEAPLTAPPAAIDVEGGSSWANLPHFAAVCLAFTWAGNKMNFPTSYFLGPAVGTSLLLMTGLSGPELPAFVVDAAQVMVGVHVGLLLKPEELTGQLKMILLSVVSGLVLVIVSLGFSLLLTLIQPVTLMTSILSLAPGGMDQMGIIAHEVGADLSMVTGYQMFRLLFVFFAVIPALGLLIRSRNRNIGQGLNR
jgi:hypothetical protein